MNAEKIVVGDENMYNVHKYHTVLLLFFFFVFIYIHMYLCHLYILFESFIENFEITIKFVDQVIYFIFFGILWWEVEPPKNFNYIHP